MTTDNPNTFANKLKFELAHFTGDLERYCHPFISDVIYTAGVRHVAERAAAYWLIDAIAIAIKSRPMRAAERADSRLADMQFWTLATQGDKATLTCLADAGEEPAYTQAVRFTDFPLPMIDIWAAWDGRHWTLYLPSEH